MLISIALLSLFTTLGSAAPAPRELNQEYPAPGEAEEFQALALKMRQIQERLRPNDPRRGFHAKALGCLKGTFEVLPDRAVDTRFGVFREQRAYPVWARFSNASGRSQPDNQSDLRGLALKLLDVGGEKILPGHEHERTQDFLLTNAPVHFARDAQEMMEFAEATSKGRAATLAYFATHPKQALTIISDARREVPSLVTEQYWSRAPIRLESRAVKYSVKPCTGMQPRMPDRPGPNYLREDLAAHATRGDICFDFVVQFQVDPNAHPIEDASVEWKVSTSPFHRVARITFPSQVVGSPGQVAFCESLSFNPWHALPEHRPLGNMNRARKLVYDSSRELRARGAPHREPDGTEVFE